MLNHYNDLSGKRLISGLKTKMYFYNDITCIANGYVDSTITFSSINSSKAFVVAQSMKNCSSHIVNLSDTSMTVRLFNLHDYDENPNTMLAEYSLLIF